MKSRYFTFSLAILACVAFIAARSFVSPVNAQGVQLELRELAEDVYVMQHPLGSSNSVFVVTEEGVVVFDADIRTADQVFAAIRRITDQPIRFLIVSHPAGDHSTGGWHFREDNPTIIASRTQVQSIAEEELVEFNGRRDSSDPIYTPYRNTEFVQPDIVFDEKLTLRFGGLTFEITDEGSAHSTSDVTLYIPEKRIFTLGDLYKAGIHTCPGDSVYESFGAARGWIKILDNIKSRNLDVDTYVPGHGVVQIGRGIADIDELRNYFVSTRAGVSEMIAQGKTEAEVVAEYRPSAEHTNYQQLDRLQRVLPYYYRPLKAEADNNSGG